MDQPDWEGLVRNRTMPSDHLAILQTWHDLIFLHASVPVEVLQAMVPPELTVEQFDGSAWLGVVPFHMSQIRHPRLPAVPWLSKFHETNVRTYVTHPVYGPGVWFLSLDAARYLPCWYARKVFKLPYFHARQTSEQRGDHCYYEGRRLAKRPFPRLSCSTTNLEAYSITVRKTEDWHPADPETFEFWLVERYRLYSIDLDNRLLSARVFHEPYQIAQAEPETVRIAGLGEQFGPLDFSSVLMAKSLNVQCFSPRLV